MNSAPHFNAAYIADRASAVRRALAGRSIVLVGIMGVGKSTIGKKLSQLLDLSYADADKEIEKAADMKIDEIFERYGEDYFRSGEKRVISRLLAGEQQVLATGGGAFMDPETRELIASRAVSVWLDADLEVLMKRVQRRPHRPLLKQADPEATMRALLEVRNPVYALADFKIQSRNVSRDVIAGEVVQMLADQLPELQSAAS